MRRTNQGMFWAIGLMLAGLFLLLKNLDHLIALIVRYPFILTGYLTRPSFTMTKRSPTTKQLKSIHFKAGSKLHLVRST